MYGTRKESSAAGYGFFGIGVLYWKQINKSELADEMDNGSVEEFDGISLVEWTPDHKIKFLKEFGRNLNHYDSYQNSDTPQFKEEKINWF